MLNLLDRKTGGDVSSKTTDEVLEECRVVVGTMLARFDSCPIRSTRGKVANVQGDISRELDRIRNEQRPPVEVVEIDPIRGILVSVEELATIIGWVASLGRVLYPIIQTTKGHKWNREYILSWEATTDRGMVMEFLRFLDGMDQ